jgi:seryl-tRNA synthetase
MLDLRFIRENAEFVAAKMALRGADVDIPDILAQDAGRRASLTSLEELRARRNALSKEVGRAKAEGKDAEAVMAEVREIGREIGELERLVAEAEERLNARLAVIPNLPHDSVPPGKSEADNVVIRHWGEPKDPGFTPRPHWELGAELGIIDFTQVSKISGSGFVTMRGDGARLEWALVALMRDIHRDEHGYTEIIPPFLVKSAALEGTGQLPKFEEDLFATRDGYYLVPTAEVPVTNLHREEILPAGSLPISYAAYTPCFRREAGAAGKETRGLIRLHQFNKVELVRIVEPSTALDQLELLTGHAEAILRRLNLPYRVVLLSAGDLGFSSAKTYDLEVWMPGMGRYVEISSCSTFGDFQARRAQIRYRPACDAKAEFCHTLNGSGLAVGRTVAAVLEGFQREDGTVAVPEALVPYLGGATSIGSKK